jgi:hypothetical protein
MKDTETSLVKIMFRFFSNVLDEWTVETVWAQPINVEKGFYKIDNIPFYAAIAYGDIVFAKYDKKEEALVYKKTVEYSENSTIQVIILDKTIEANDVINSFINLGCEVEHFSDGYFVINVLVEQNYTPIKSKLSELQEKGILDYAEPCLSVKHQQDEE